MIAHVGGVPVEELLPLVPAIGASAALLLARARTATSRIARHPGRRRASEPTAEQGR
jgi:hypothetical protein